MTEPAFPGLPADLTEGEQRVVRAAREGGRARVRDQVVRAAVVRELVLQNAAQAVGIVIDGATIDGVLDLEGFASEVPLLFFGCTFGEPGQGDAPIVLRDARLRRLGLYDCAVHGGIKAERVQIESSLFMGQARVTGTVRMRGARIGGSLNLEECVFRDPGNALVLDSAEVRGNFLMREAKVEGTLRLLGAQIDGSLLMESASFAAAENAIVADGVVVHGAWVLNRANVRGRLRLRSAQLRGLVAAEAVFAHAKGPAIDASSARIDGDLGFDRARVEGGLSVRHARIEGRLEGVGALFSGAIPALDAVGTTLGQGLSLEGAEILGGVALDGARVGRDLQMSRIRAVNAAGDAISADVVRVEGNWALRGARVEGTVRLSGAHVEGELEMSECHVERPAGVAIRADGLHLDGGWLMERARIRGLVRFPAATVGNQLRFSGSIVEVPRGPALFASSTTVARGVVLADGFATVGAVVFDQAQLHGTLDLRGSMLVSARLDRGGPVLQEDAGEHLVHTYDDAVLSLVDARVDRLQLPRKAEHRPKGIVNLARAATGSLEDHAAAWPPHGPGVDDTYDHLLLDGFTYEHLENPAGIEVSGQSAVRVWQQRLAWLEGMADRDLNEFFKPAPWVQLARRLRAQGFHEDARQISIARRRRHRASRSVSPAVRVQSQLLDWFALYGHAPWRTVAWIVVFVALFAGVWEGAAATCPTEDCRDEEVFVRVKRGDFSDDPAALDATYPEFNALAYSFDLFVPIVDFGHREFWRPNTRYAPVTALDVPVLGQTELTVGQGLYLLTIVEMLLGLILTSLAVTGFTGLIGRDE